jgi:hypothetical protein
VFVQVLRHEIAAAASNVTERGAAAQAIQHRARSCVAKFTAVNKINAPEAANVH